MSAESTAHAQVDPPVRRPDGTIPAYEASDFDPSVLLPRRPVLDENFFVVCGEPVGPVETCHISDQRYLVTKVSNWHLQNG